MIEVLQKEKIFEIDTSSYSVDEISNSITNNIQQIIERQNFCNELLQNVGKIDWILTLNEEGTLNSFFQEDYGEKFIINLKDIEEDESQGEKEK